MDREFLVSIIIPVYNVENYLSQCLDSILSQPFRDFEVILVDDESNDSSPEICMQYAAGDARIKVIRKKNGGAAAARNTGIKAASGKYILFIDGDDYIEPGSLRKIFDKNEEDGGCDVVFLKSLSVFPDGAAEPNDVYDKNNYYKKSRAEVLSYLSAHDPLPVCVWGKLIRREFLIENGIFFTEGIICEDVDFCIRLYMHAKTYNYIGEMYYYYRKNRSGSVMNVNTDRKFYDLLYIISEWVRLADTDYKEYAGYIHTILAFQYCMLLPMYKNMSKAARASKKRKAADLAWLLGHSADKRVRLLNSVYKIFGFECVSGLLSAYHKFKELRVTQG